MHSTRLILPRTCTFTRIVHLLLLLLLIRALALTRYYWRLSNGSAALGGGEGQAVFQALINAAAQRKVQIRIVQNEPTDMFPDPDSAFLAQHGLAQVRSINWSKLVGQGILHTKLIIVDQRHVYIGSANMGT